MKHITKVIIGLFFFASMQNVSAQVYSSTGQLLSPTPPMGWMSWNFFGDNINEKDLMEMADALVSSGMKDAGYEYIFIDDGWQGGRDKKNNMIADPVKFPSGIKALAGYVHSKGLKLGIYSDAAQLTCAGYTASLGFEEQDAKTFAQWDVDYLKYDYCNAPSDAITAQVRYKAMADALRKSGREILFGVCEWGGRQPWRWASQIGGQLWRTTDDVRDKWEKKPTEKWGVGVMDILDVNAELNNYAGPGHWNDPDMLITGLYGKKGPSGDGGGVGCNDIEYQSQFSLWAMMNAPLYATNDLRNMNNATKNILLNKDMIAINQDALGKQAERKIKTASWNIFTKPLANGDVAVAILNRGNTDAAYVLNLSAIGLTGKYEWYDVWEHKTISKSNKWNGMVKCHETKVFRLKLLK